jgi:hypothetical protein
MKSYLTVPPGRIDDEMEPNPYQSPDTHPHEQRLKWPHCSKRSGVSMLEIATAGISSALCAACCGSYSAFCAAAIHPSPSVVEYGLVGTVVGGLFGAAAAVMVLAGIRVLDSKSGRGEGQEKDSGLKPDPLFSSLPGI